MSIANEILGVNIMKLEYKDYIEKVRGCWNGKNIGGTLGAPFECIRREFDVSYYQQDLNKPLPNDDLDLQLVWLNAVEKHGRGINSHILGEYWLSHIIPAWAEYGAGKNNMRMGLVPPLSGYVGNKFRDSNGSYILMEIWACLCPGHPELAVKYAYEDATVDHSKEGVYASVFIAAIESAAFAESDRDTLIDIGLSYLPEDSAIHKAVACARKCHETGMTWKEARKKLLQEIPCSFGLIGTDPRDIPSDEPIGPMGYDAPCHMGLIVMAWLYGEGDFDRSICIAASCGEDSDCTAGTLAAILGIINGNSAIDEKWLRPLGGFIETTCVNLNDSRIKIPKTIDELVERVAKQTARFLDAEFIDFMSEAPGYDILIDESALFYKPQRLSCWYSRDNRRLMANQFVVKHHFVPFDVYVDYGGEPYITCGEPKKFILTFENNYLNQQWLNVNVILPEGWEISPARGIAVCLEQAHCNVPLARITLEITPDFPQKPRYDVLIQITSAGRHMQGIVPIVLLSGVDSQITEE